MFVHSQRAAGAENAAERSSLNGPLRARSKDPMIRVFRDAASVICKDMSVSGEVFGFVP